MIKNSKENDPISVARKVLEIESDAIRALIPRLNNDFLKTCQICIECQTQQARIAVIGLGKSGHVGNKIAATLASTGSPSFFVHAAEARHGEPDRHPAAREPEEGPARGAAHRVLGREERDPTSKG